MDQEEMSWSDLLVAGAVLLALFIGCGAAWSLGEDECAERQLGGCSALRR